jgi:hypothetical protein
MLRVRIIRGRILLQLRILPFSGHHRHTPDVRCKPESALCPSQSADPHSAAAAATYPQQVKRLSACLGQVAETLQRIQVEWSCEKGTNLSRLRMLQTLAEHGGPVSTQPEREGKLQHSKLFLRSLVDRRTLAGLLHREQSVRDRRKAVLWNTTDKPSDGPEYGMETLADALPAGIGDPPAVAVGCRQRATASAGSGLRADLTFRSETTPDGSWAGSVSSVPFDRPIGALR